MYMQKITHSLPSTILDLARYPEEDFRAPLNTKKLAPVTKRAIKNSLVKIDPEMEGLRIVIKYLIIGNSNHNHS